MKRTLDFDKFMQEKQGDTIEVKLYGKTYTVKAEIPATVPILMARSEEAADQQVQFKLVFKAADAMLGTQAVNEICDKGISTNDLAKLVKMLFDMINGVDEDEETEELTDEDSRKAIGGKRKKA